MSLFFRVVTKKLIHTNQAGNFVIKQPFSPSLLGLSIHSLKKNKTKPHHVLSYLGVTHAGCSNEGLLDGVALLKHPLLLASHRPVTLNQELDNLQMTSECSMDQSTLPILIQVIHLRDREARVNEGLWLYSQPRHMRPLHMSRLPRSVLPSPPPGPNSEMLQRTCSCSGQSSTGYRSGRHLPGENLIS